MSVFHNGQHEKLKLAVHAALGSLALVCLGYNAIAFALRRDRHLALNVAVYGALVAAEVRQVQHHWRDR